MERRRVLGAAALALPAMSALEAAAAPAAQGQPVAWPAVRLLDGSELAPAHWQGRAAVVVFWSTTCPYCRRHNQHLEKLHRAAAALPGQPLQVLGVARENDAAAVQRYARQQGWSFPITLDNRALAAALSERRMSPLTAVVARDGRLKQVLPGEMFEEDVMELLQLAQAGGRT
jgi:thiol-disulfide isomerase/thioredoxin